MKAARLSNPHGSWLDMVCSHCAREKAAGDFYQEGEEGQPEGSWCSSREEQGDHSPGGVQTGKQPQHDTVLG